MTVAINTEGRGVMSIDITGVASTAAGGQGEVENPEGATVLILRATLYAITNPTGSANISVGVAASGGAFTDIINALAMDAAAGKVYNGHAMQNTAKTEITAPALWTTSKVLGITASASLAGFTGRLLLEYVRL